MSDIDRHHATVRHVLDEALHGAPVEAAWISLDALRDLARNEERLCHTAMQDANRWYDLLEAAERRLAEHEAALRRLALHHHKSQSHPRDFTVCTWPECRRAKGALAGSVNTPADREACHSCGVTEGDHEWFCSVAPPAAAPSSGEPA